MMVFFFLPLPRTPSSNTYQHMHYEFAIWACLLLDPFLVLFLFYWGGLLQKIEYRQRRDFLLCRL
jgi:hypothetical protein